MMRRSGDVNLHAGSSTLLRRQEFIRCTKTIVEPLVCEESVPAAGTDGQALRQSVSGSLFM